MPVMTEPRRIFLGAFLFTGVDWLEPNRRFAIILKCAIVAAGGIATAEQLLPYGAQLGGEGYGLIKIPRSLRSTPASPKTTLSLLASQLSDREPALHP
jgi:hypothetical protein